MSEFNLATATKQQLKDYSMNNYELVLSLTMNEDTMRDRIIDHCQRNNLEVPFAKLIVKRQADRKGEWMTINIAKQDRAGGNEPVFVGVQGVGYLIPRGMDISVPKKVVHVLENAEQDIVTQDPDTGEMLHNPVRTYPFNVVHSSAA